MRSNLYEDQKKNTDVRKYVKEAVVAFSKTPKGVQALKDIATGTGIREVNDDVYADIRQIVMKTDTDLEKMLVNKAKKKKK